MEEGKATPQQESDPPVAKVYDSQPAEVTATAEQPTPQQKTVVVAGSPTSNQGVAVVPNPPTSNQAIWSLVCGILTILLGWVFGLGICVGPVAIILGAQAKKRINESGGSLTGDGLAIGGIVTGSIGLAFSVISLVFWVIPLLIFLATGPAIAASAASAAYQLDDDIWN